MFDQAKEDAEFIANTRRLVAGLSRDTLRWLRGDSRLLTCDWPGMPTEAARSEAAAILQAARDEALKLPEGN